MELTVERTIERPYLSNTEGRNMVRIRPHVRLYFNPINGEFNLSDRSVYHNVMLIPITAWSCMVTELKNVFGSGSAVILQQAGETMGRESAKSILGDTDEEETIRRGFSSTSNWGFGRYELLSFVNGEHIRFRLFNNLAMAVDDAKDDVFKHHFLIGFYRGYFSTVFRKEVCCEEKSCMNLGDGHCEFDITCK